MVIEQSERRKSGRALVNESVQFTPELGELCIKAYSQFGVQIASAQAAGISVSVLRSWLSKYATFKEGMAMAKEEYIERLELIMHKRINENSSKMADTLLMFKLKKEVPAYRDANIYNNTNVSGDIKIISMVPRPGQKADVSKIIEIAADKKEIIDQPPTSTPALPPSKTSARKKTAKQPISI